MTVVPLDRFQNESATATDCFEDRTPEGWATPSCEGKAVEKTRPMADADSVLPALLAVHKAALAVERRSLERIHGRLSAAEFLQIVSDPLRYGWLRPLNELILAFEEDGEERLPNDALVERARDLLAPPKEKTPFGRRYLSLMQREPALVFAHRDLAKLLRA